MKKFTRRSALTTAGAGLLVTIGGCERRESQASRPKRGASDEEYVWLSANANLPMFTAQDQPALRHAGTDLGVKVTTAGPNTIDIAALVGAIEQTIARRPTGIMVVGWDPSALVAPINQAIERGIPV